MKSVSVALFAGFLGCMFVEPISAADATIFKEKILHSFCSQQNCADGAEPSVGLIDVNGTLFGTTETGGAQQYGTAFSLDPNTGTETVVYSFCGITNCSDGAVPLASLTDVNGVLYGTTEMGGNNIGFDTSGIVFALDLNTDTEAPVYAFCSEVNCTDGSQPVSNVIYAKGMLYGTTASGGPHTGGTVFSLDPKTGTETVLLAFDDSGDGRSPEAGLIDVNGKLYGTTSAGGRPQCGCGTVFSIDPSAGSVKVLYQFCRKEYCRDGAMPLASLINVNGMLYGTTSAGGGVGGCGGDGCGTVFSVDPNTGVEKVVYSFCRKKNCKDGAMPLASLINVNGMLYGTTGAGGIPNRFCYWNSCGTAFSIDPDSGAETVLYSFCSKEGCTDGANPTASLIAVNGNLYGTTSAGGLPGNCPLKCGIVFELKKER